MRITIAMKTLFLIVALVQSAGTGTITGRLVYPDGSVAAGTVLAAVPVEPSEDRPVAGFARTNDAGVYRFGNIAPGRYYIRADESHLPALRPDGTATDAAAVATVRPGSTANLDLLLTGSFYKVRGHVSRQTGTETLRVRIAGGAPFQIGDQLVGEDGKFEFGHVRSGTYQ